MALPSSRSLLATILRPRFLLALAFASATVYLFIFSGPSHDLKIINPIHPSRPQANTPNQHEKSPDTGSSSSKSGKAPSMGHGKVTEKVYWDIQAEDLKNWRDPDDHENPNDVERGTEQDGTERDEGSVSRLQHEKDMRKIWRYVYKSTANLGSSNLIYGKTLAELEDRDNRTAENEKKLSGQGELRLEWTAEKPARFNPYPDYNTDSWISAGYAPYTPCNGPLDKPVEDLFVFKGRPVDWPAPLMGSYSALGLDPNICWERETRLGPYGLLEQSKVVNGKRVAVDWNNVKWGELQDNCAKANARRFKQPKITNNPYTNTYPDVSSLINLNTMRANRRDTIPEQVAPEKVAVEQKPAQQVSGEQKSSEKKPTEQMDVEQKPTEQKAADQKPVEKKPGDYKKETRTAILLRSYTGKKYSENDKQTIRAMISEVSLRSGGKYQVYLLMHVKDRNLQIENPAVLKKVLDEQVPPEFHSITVAWNDQAVWKIYTEMKDNNERSVHTAQWLSVQKFSHEHPEFDFIWNWEMDFRYTGHHYDLLESLDKFGRDQPRKGMWERSDRWYIPKYHGDYNTEFRQDIEKRYGDDTVWGPPELPFINPVGPKPPHASPKDDNYEWGVGEDADVITTGPMFDPIHSNWIIGSQVWNYKDDQHRSKDLPRRSTIVTQSRISKRVLDIMHVENMRGNHVASEMTPQTVALIHGLKALHAPHPVFMDRSWNGQFLNNWFNPGPNGTSGSYGSPMGWGRERRYQGSSWYYRAEPPNRMYNNWMGWIDTEIGGEKWEQTNGRPCLPSIMLHPVKQAVPTEEGHRTGFELAYG